MFLERVDALRAWAADRPGVRVGVAVHSVRAVPAAWISAVGEYAERHGLVRHVHAAEQVRELSSARPSTAARRSSCWPSVATWGRDERRPRHPRLGSRRRALADSGRLVVTCPTTEGNLGDGRFPGCATGTRG